MDGTIDPSRVSIQMFIDNKDRPYAAMCVDGQRLPGLICSEVKAAVNDLPTYTATYSAHDWGNANPPKEKPPGTDEHKPAVTRVDGNRWRWTKNPGPH